MQGACKHAGCMSTTKLLQIRNIPASLHRRLKMRAASHGKTLSELGLEALVRYDEQPTIDEWLAELRKLPRSTSKVAAADLIRQARDSR